MSKSKFYHAGCPVCVRAEESIVELIGKGDVEVIHLGNSKNRIVEAEREGVKSVPALVTPEGNVLHTSYAASMEEVKA